MSEIRKISVVGAGSLGTIFGGLIGHHRPQLELLLVGRGPHCEAIRERGRVQVRGAWGSYEVPVRATSELSEAAGSDLILFTVKTQDTSNTARQLASFVDDAIVVSLQNGINQKCLMQYLPVDRLIVGMTTTNMSMPEPGVVTLNRNGVSVIGAAGNDVPESLVEQARTALSWSGLQIESSDRILGVQYNKLLLNTVGYASVLSASDFIREGVLDGPWRRSVAIPLINEGMAVLKAAGIELQRVSGGSDVISLKRLMHLLNTPGLDGIARSVIKLLNPPRLIYSVHQDLLRKRPTEIEYVNGEIVRVARDHGIQACYNAEVVRMIHELESAEGIVFPSRREVVERFRGLRSRPQLTSA